MQAMEMTRTALPSRLDYRSMCIHMCVSIESSCSVLSLTSLIFPLFSYLFLLPFSLSSLSPPPFSRLPPFLSPIPLSSLLSSLLPFSSPLFNVSSFFLSIYTLLMSSHQLLNPPPPLWRRIEVVCRRLNDANDRLEVELSRVKEQCSAQLKKNESLEAVVRSYIYTPLIHTSFPFFLLLFILCLS